MNREKGSSILSGIVTLALVGGASFVIAPTVTLQSQLAQSALPTDIQASDQPETNEEELVSDNPKSVPVTCSSGGPTYTQTINYACFQTGDSTIKEFKQTQNCRGFSVTVKYSDKTYSVTPTPLPGPSLDGCSVPSRPVCANGSLAFQSSNNEECKYIEEKAGDAAATKKAEELVKTLNGLDGTARLKALESLNLDAATESEIASLLRRQSSLERFVQNFDSQIAENNARLQAWALDCPADCEATRPDLILENERIEAQKQLFQSQIDTIRGQQVSLFASALPSESARTAFSGNQVEGYTPPTGGSTFGSRTGLENSPELPSNRPQESLWSFSNLTSATKSVTDGLRSATQYVRDTVLPAISDTYSAAVTQARSFTNNAGTNWGQFYSQGSIPQARSAQPAIIGPDFSIAGEPGMGTASSRNQLVPISKNLPPSTARVIDVAKTKEAIDLMNDSDPYKSRAQQALDEYTKSVDSLSRTGSGAQAIENTTSSYENILKSYGVAATMANQTDEGTVQQTDSVNALTVNKAEIESFGFFSNPLKYGSQDGEGVLDTSVDDSGIIIRKGSDEGWVQVTTQGTRTDVYAPSIAETLQSGETMEFGNGEVTFRNTTYKVDSGEDSVTYRDVAFSLTNPGVRTAPTEAQFADARNALTSQLNSFSTAQNTSPSETTQIGEVTQASFVPPAGFFDSVRNSVANWLNPGPSDIAGISGLVSEGQIESITSNADGTFRVNYSAGNIVRSAVTTEADLTRSGVNVNEYIRSPFPEINLSEATRGMTQEDLAGLFAGGAPQQRPFVYSGDYTSSPGFGSSQTGGGTAANPIAFVGSPEAQPSSRYLAPLASQNQAGFGGAIFNSQTGSGSLTGQSIYTPPPSALTTFGTGLTSPISSSGWDWNAAQRAFSEYRGSLPTPSVPQPVTPTFPANFSEQSQIRPLSISAGENISTRFADAFDTNNQNISGRFEDAFSQTQRIPMETVSSPPQSTGFLGSGSGGTFRSAQDLIPTEFAAIQALPEDASLRTKLEALGTLAQREEIVERYFSEQLPGYRGTGSQNALLAQLAKEYEGVALATPSYTPPTTALSPDVRAAIQDAVATYPAGDSIMEFCKMAFGSGASCSSSGADRLRLIEAVGFENYAPTGSNNVEVLRRLRVQFGQ